MRDSLQRVLPADAAGGVCLFLAAALAMVVANTGAAGFYDALLELPMAVRVGTFAIDKPLLLWINDGLMAVFFLLIGLELKREIVAGDLSRPSQVVLPAVAAMGGMAAPAAIYAAFNWGDAQGLRGWAIPAATDIAFALGVLSLLGARVPGGLKIFLLTLAILDDLGAIVIIALFFTEGLSVPSLVVAGLALAVLGLFKYWRVERAAPYLLVGVVLWASVLKSGVHATLAGVALALFIPGRAARRLEDDLHPPVAYGILPIFAFANAGVPLHGVTASTFFQPVPLGIAAGLVIGKLAGVFLAALAVVRLGGAALPAGANWLSMLGVAALCGIGFTMSLFIAGLAFEGAAGDYSVQTRLGILAGSALAGVLGLALLSFAHPRARAAPGRSPH